MKRDEIIAIGWDVRGWQSRAQAVAFAALDDSGLSWPALAPAFAFETGRRPGPDRLVDATGNPDLARRIEHAARVVVAIDAPLAFPRAFTALLLGRGRPRRMPSEIENPLAYRDCDRWIRRAHGKKPLSASYDRLGNPATLAMAVCFALRDAGYRVVPIDGGPSDRSVIEVYPGVHKRGSSRIDAAIEPLARHLPDEVEPGSDLYDAAICALLGVVFAGGAERLGLPGLEGPEDDHPTDEGWIYALAADYVGRARTKA
jgi:predicted nuclease with RNAse H fold